MNAQRLFLVRWRGRQMGPYSVQTIQEKLETNEFGLMHEIQTNNTWITLERFFEPAAPVRPVKSPETANAARAFQAAGSRYSAPPPLRIPGSAGRKKRLTYILLAVLAGFSGVHNFYVGAWTRGLMQLLISVLGSVAGYGIFVPWLWAGGEMLIIRRDGKGRRFI